MGAVTVLALGGVGSFSIQGLAVGAGVEFQLDVVVTVAAKNGGQGLFVRQVFDVGFLMAEDALDVLVNGASKSFFVHKEGNGLPRLLRGQIRIGMTVETSFVVDGVRGNRQK
jgi:hypothetical protein